MSESKSHQPVLKINWLHVQFSNSPHALQLTALQVAQYFGFSSSPSSGPDRFSRIPMSSFRDSIFIPHHVMSCHVMSCHVMSCHVRSCHVMSCHVMSCHAMPCHAMPCHAMPCHVMSCHAMSCHVMSCHVMSCHVMSCHTILCEKYLYCTMLLYTILHHVICYTRLWRENKAVVRSGSRSLRLEESGNPS